jgi:hypothetical protein
MSFLRLYLAGDYGNRPAKFSAGLFSDFVDIAELESAYFTCFNASGLAAFLLPFNAVIALDGYLFTCLHFSGRVISDDIERAYHGAHAAGNAFIAVDQHNIHIVIAANSAGGTGLLAGSRVTMTAFTGEGSIHVEAGSSDDKSFRDWFFAEGADQVLSLGMFHQAGQFALATANTALRINKDGIHRNSSSNYSAFVKYPKLEAAVLEYTLCYIVCQYVYRIGF